MQMGKREWQDKKVAAVGLGLSNLALMQFLKDKGAYISGRDQKTALELRETLPKLKELAGDLKLGPGYLDGLTEYDVVFLSPGVPKNLPEIKALKKLGLLDSEIGLVFRGSPAPIYGITGSSGKTTTTSLVGAMLKESGLNPRVGGNIGTPLITEIEKLTPADCLVLELSSFQLEGLGRSPKGALLTNISPNHLDVHTDMAEYIGAKTEIYRFQNPDDFVILNYDDPLAWQMAEEAAGQVYFFSLKSELEKGAFLKGEELVYADESGSHVFAGRAKLVLPGRHNVANILAAAIMSHLIGAEWQAIENTAHTFAGVPHRLELIGEITGVRYFNDSIATSPARTLAALDSFQAPLILLAGGSDKKLSFSELGRAVRSRVKRLVLFGNTAEAIKEAVLAEGNFPVEIVADLAEALLEAASCAKRGDVVLLSPACASYDQYPNFMARGDHFRNLVENLAK